MAVDETVREEARAKVVGLGRWFQARPLNGLTRLLLVMLIGGGLCRAVTPAPHTLATACIYLSVGVGVAAVMAVRTLLIVRDLRVRQIEAVARLTKRQ